MLPIAARRFFVHHRDAADSCAEVPDSCAEVPDTCAEVLDTCAEVPRTSPRSFRYLCEGLHTSPHLSGTSRGAPAYLSASLWYLRVASSYLSASLRYLRVAPSYISGKCPLALRRVFVPHPEAPRTSASPPRGLLIDAGTQRFETGQTPGCRAAALGGPGDW